MTGRCAYWILLCLACRDSRPPQWPTPGAETVRYGGNTSCLEVELPNGSMLVLDAGTGIRGLGLKLERRNVRHIQLLLTHLHLDHVEGLRFFEPLWNEEVEIDIWGPPSPVVGLRERIGQMHGRWRDVLLLERRSPLV